MGIVLGGYGRTLVKLERYEDAEPALNEAYTLLDAGEGSDSEGTTLVVEALIDLYDAWGKPEKAAEWRAKLAETEEEPGSE